MLIMYITFENGNKEVFSKLKFFERILKHECLSCEDILLVRNGESIIMCIDNLVFFDMIQIIAKILTSEFLEGDSVISEYYKNFFNDESKDFISELSERNIQFIECDLSNSIQHRKGYYRKEENFTIRVLSSFSCEVIKKFINKKLDLYTITKIISDINKWS